MPERQRYDTLIPELRITIDGQELPADARADLVAANVMEDVNAASMFSFTLVCWDGEKMAVKWIDDDLFKEGNGFQIEIGYRDKLESLFKGEITGLEPEFSIDKPPTLTVRGYDRRHRLMGKRKTRTFLNMKDSDIASQIAGDWGLTPDVDDTRVQLDYVLQHNQTDFDFLRERALRIGHELVVTERKLEFRARKNEGSGSVTLRRQVELLEFHVRLTAVGQVEEVLVQGWSPKDKEKLVARAGAGDEKRMGGSASGPATARNAFGRTGSMTVDTPVLSQAEADQLANNWLKENALHYIAGHGTCIGRPDLKPGRLVQIEGLGKRFSGPYYVISTDHRISPRTGYRTAISVKRNAT